VNKHFIKGFKKAAEKIKKDEKQDINFYPGIKTQVQKEQTNAEDNPISSHILTDETVSQFDRY
jgi:hypothetical protein